MKLSFIRFEGVVFRGHNPRRAFAPESGDGARRRGGRFNRRGVPALYTSLNEKTAWLEAQQSFPRKAQPLTIACYAVDCANILDLTEPAVRTASHAPLEELACAWEDIADRGSAPPSWLIADQLMKAGCAGVIAPSFANGASADNRNLVFWHWSRDAPRRVRVIDDEGQIAEKRSIVALSEQKSRPVSGAADSVSARKLSARSPLTPPP